MKYTKVPSALAFLLMPLAIHAMGPRPQPGQSQAPVYQNASDLINNKKEVELANSFFSGKLIVEEPAFPLRLAGAIAWTDDKGEITNLSYTRLLPDEKIPEAQVQKDVLFESLVDRAFSLNAKYLAFVSGEMSDQDKAAVTIQTTLKAIGPEFLSTRVSAALPGIVAKLRKEGRRIFYTETVQYVLSTSSVLKKSDASATGAFIVNIGGSYYQSTTRTSNRRFAVAEFVEITGADLRPLKYPGVKPSYAIKKVVETATLPE